jgi:hypothetical protein
MRCCVSIAILASQTRTIALLSLHDLSYIFHCVWPYPPRLSDEERSMQKCIPHDTTCIVLLVIGTFKLFRPETCSNEQVSIRTDDSMIRRCSRERLFDTKMQNLSILKRTCSVSNNCFWELRRRRLIDAESNWLGRPNSEVVNKNKLLTFLTEDFVPLFSKMSCHLKYMISSWSFIKLNYILFHWLSIEWNETYWSEY